MTISGASGISARRLSPSKMDAGRMAALSMARRSPRMVSALPAVRTRCTRLRVAFLFRSLRGGTRPCLRGRPMRRSSFLRADGAGHSGLGDVEVLGGAREASCVLDGEEVLELADFHRLLLSCFFYYYNKYERKLLGMLLKNIRKREDSAVSLSILYNLP